MSSMPFLLAILLLGPAETKNQVPEVEQYLKSGENSRAIAVLKEIGTHKGNDEEAVALVGFIRTSRLARPPEITEAAFLALRGIGSRKVTRKVLALLDHSTLKKDPQIRIGVARALEGSADPLGIEPIIKLLRDKDDQVVAAAARAAGAYRYEKESTRKDFFKTIVGNYESTWNLKNSVDPDKKVERARAERKWEVIEGPMERSLQLLSNTVQPDPPSWRRWWNKNKKKKWASLDN